MSLTQENIKYLEENNPKLLLFINKMNKLGAEVDITFPKLRIIGINFKDHKYIPTPKSIRNIKNGNYQDFILTSVVNGYLPEEALELFGIPQERAENLRRVDTYPLYTKNKTNVMFGWHFDIEGLQKKLQEQGIISKYSQILFSTNQSMFMMVQDNHIYHFSIEDEWMQENGFKLTIQKFGDKEYKIWE